MSELRSLNRWMPGVLLVGVSAALAIIYRSFPLFEDAWSRSGQMLFWSIVALLQVLGLFRLAIALLPESKRRRFSSLRRHRVLIPREGLVYLVIMIVLFVGSLLGHANMLMLVFAMLAGPFVINGWSAFAMLKSCQLSRSVPRGVLGGGLLAVALVLRDPRLWMSLWMMQVRDTVTGGSESLGPTSLFTCVPPKGRQVGHYTLRLRHRGLYTFGPLHVTSRFPLGLIERGQMFPLADQVLVYPRIGRLTQHAQRQLLGAEELSSDRRAQVGVFHDEFHHLREYRAGDNPRAIHWRTSARRGSLILREYEQNREQQVSVIVDLWQPSVNVSVDDKERTEWALCLAATVCLAQRRQSRDSRLSLLASGKSTIAWEGRATAASLESLLDQLATIQAGAADQTCKLLQQAWRGGAGSSRYVVISTRTVGREAWQRTLTELLPSGAMQKLQWVFVDPAAMSDWVRLEDQ